MKKIYVVFSYVHGHAVKCWVFTDETEAKAHTERLNSNLDGFWSQIIKMEPDNMVEYWIEE